MHAATCHRKDFHHGKGYAQIQLYSVEGHKVNHSLKPPFYVKNVKNDSLDYRIYAHKAIVLTPSQKQPTHIPTTPVHIQMIFTSLHHGIERVQEFLQAFKERLVDYRWQKWNEHLSDLVCIEHTVSENI